MGKATGMQDYVVAVMQRWLASRNHWEVAL